MFFFNQNAELVAINSQGLGYGLPLAEKMAALHLQSLKELESLSMENSPGLQVETGLLYHALNMFVEGMDQILLGRFDTLLYLFRPMFDIGSMILVTRRNDDVARQMLDGELKASDTRKTVVTMLKEAGYDDEAKRIEADWKDVAPQIQFASHVTVNHVFGLLEERPTGSVAIAGGRPDAEEAKNKGRVVIAAEMRTLSYLRGNHAANFGPETLAEFDRLEADAKDWLRSTR